MRIYLAICFILAFSFAGVQADAQTLEGTHAGRIISSKQDGQVTDMNFLGVVQITPQYIGYTHTCASSFVGRDGNRLGGKIEARHLPPQPAIECAAYPQDVAMFSAIMAGADEMRYMQGPELVFIYADGEEIVVLERASEPQAQVPRGQGA